MPLNERKIYTKLHFEFLNKQIKIYHDLILLEPHGWKKASDLWNLLWYLSNSLKFNSKLHFENVGKGKNNGKGDGVLYHFYNHFCKD
jgi:hypothetical protein